MGEKANVTSDELAAAAASGSLIGTQVEVVGGAVRDKVVDHTLDAAIARSAGKSDDEEQQDPGKEV